MFKALFKWFRGDTATAESDAGDRFEALNHRAPLREHSDPATSKSLLAGSTLLCRETLLGRDQRVFGYRFMLRESARNRIRNSSRVVHHVYAEVLIGNLLQADVARLLGHRIAFVGLPDSFLTHAGIRRLPVGNTVFVLECIEDGAAPDIAELKRHMDPLRSAGYRFAGCMDTLEGAHPALLESLDFVILSGITSDPMQVRDLAAVVATHKATLIATDLSAQDDFDFFHALGAQGFHGPFITRREEWRERKLSPDVVQAKPLFDALRSDAESEEIVELIKRNPALALRLLRYVNSAASGLGHKLDSIEAALQIVGRERLARWVMMVLLSHHPKDGRSHAVLEAALIRARMLELMADRTGGDSETLFLVGLLSLVDVVFQVDMTHALDALAVSGEIRQAIAEGDGRHAAPLAMAMAWEKGDPEAIEAAAAACGITPEIAADHYMQALWWALDVRP